MARRSSAVLGLIAVLVCGFALEANAQTEGGGAGGSLVSQTGTNLDKTQTSSTNATNVITLTGVANTRIRLYGLSANCSAGSATIAITDGGTTVWTLSGSPVPATPGVLSSAWTPLPYTSTGANQSLVITVGACGSGNTSVLNVQADQY